MKDYNEKFYRSEDFNKFPWEKLVEGEYATNGKNYSFGKGGVGYPNGRGWQITVYEDDDMFSSETWELPKIISNMLDHQEEYGKKENQRKIQHSIRELFGL